MPPLAHEQALPRDEPLHTMDEGDCGMMDECDPHTMMDEGDLAEAAANAAQVLKVDLSEPSCFEEATTALHAGELVLRFLADTCKSSGVQESHIWTALLTEAGQGVAGSAVMPRSPPAQMHVHPHTTTVGPANCSGRVEAAAAAISLRDLLRISICDDNDLNLARRVVTDSKVFFTALSTAARERAVPPSELWNALDALER